MNGLFRIAVVTAVLAGASLPAVASAHVTLQPNEVPAGAFKRLDVRVRRGGTVTDAATGSPVSNTCVQAVNAAPPARPPMRNKPSLLRSHGRLRAGGDPVRVLDGATSV